jgi:hypothetical protein
MSHPGDPGPERHIDAERPGELVGIDCFYVGRLLGTNGAIWQLTAIDVYASYAWAELVIEKGHTVSARNTSRFARRVAAELKAAGWQLERFLSDNGNEFKVAVGSPGKKTSSRCQRAHGPVLYRRPVTEPGPVGEADVDLQLGPSGTIALRHHDEVTARVPVDVAAEEALVALIGVVFPTHVTALRRIAEPLAQRHHRAQDAS